MAYMITLLRRYFLLILLGSISELIYCLYFVPQFSLFRYYRQNIDLGHIVHHSFLGFGAFFVAVTALFVLFSLAWWQTRTYREHTALWIIVGFGMLFGMTTICIYPITAIDVYVYLAESVALVTYHINPMTIPPGLVHNPIIQLAGGWADVPAPYGPIAVLVSAIPVVFGGQNLLADLIGIKLLFAGFLLLESFLIYKILSSYAKPYALAGALFVAWNPYLLIEYVANAHNDIIMILLTTLAIYFMVKHDSRKSFASLILSSFVKYATVVLFPLFFLYGFFHQHTHKKKVTYALSLLLIMLIVTVIFYLPFWQRGNPLQMLLSQNTRYMSSFSTFLAWITVQTITKSQAALFGHIVFIGIFFLSLFFAFRNTISLFAASFLILFSLLAFGITNVEVWYLFWPVLFGILLPNRFISFSLIVCLYTTSLSVILFGYFWWQMGLTDPSVAMINGISYLLTFMPAISLLLGFLVYRFVFQRKLFNPEQK